MMISPFQVLMYYVITLLFTNKGLCSKMGFMETLKKHINVIVIFVFASYLVCGLFIVKDYGISTDEFIERETTLINVEYVMSVFIEPEKNPIINQILTDRYHLHDWTDKYYGVALQMLTVPFEYLFERSYRNIFLIRHIYTFLNYFVAGIFFYFLLKRRFTNVFIPLIGLLMFILYPRFFGESFYNIKDILFFSWSIISSYFVLRWLDDDGGKKFLLPAAVSIAIAINTRILGLSILMLALAFLIFIQLMKNADYKIIILKTLGFASLSFLIYVIITPFLWANPFKNTIAIFTHFKNFEPWPFTHLYLGEMITQNVPWHYIPVWMGVTVPILYLVLFLAGMVFLIRKCIRRDIPPMYDSFFGLMFLGTLMGFIAFRITMYEGWRHAYFIWLPFLYLCLTGLEQALIYVQNKNLFKINMTIIVFSLVSAGLIFQLGWIIKNHPYQYVYFNVIGRQIAEEKFSLDYWEVSHTDLLRYALKDAGERFITVKVHARNYHLLLPHELTRVECVIDSTIPYIDYYIDHTRKPLHERVAPEGFLELKSIIVDGMKISTLYKKDSFAN